METTIDDDIEFINNRGTTSDKYAARIAVAQYEIHNDHYRLADALAEIRNTIR